MADSIEVEVELHVEEIQDAVQKAAENALNAVGMQAATLARMELQNSPSRIDTGLLRNSITHALAGKPAAISEYKGSDTHTSDSPSAVKRGLVGKPAPPPHEGHYTASAPADDVPTVYVGTNVEYAAYVHEGTDRMKANHFLKNAVEKNKAEFEKIIRDVLHDSMG